MEERTTMDTSDRNVRPSRIEHYLELAKIVAKRSTCGRAGVGAVLVDAETNKIVATGYNGSAKGSPHCTDVGCLLVEGHCIRTIHAEMNALLHLEKSYTRLHLYCTHQPCYNCYKALVSSNVSKVIYLNTYIDLRRDLLIKEKQEMAMLKY